MKIRKATRKDIDSIAKLGIEYGKYESKLDKSYKIGSFIQEKKIVKKFFETKEVQWFLVQDSKEIYGFVAFSIDKRGNLKKGVLHTIFLKEEFRKKGYGRRLLNEALRELKQLGCSSVRSHVLTKNKKSLEMYKRNGFDVEKNSGYTIFKKLK